MTELPNEDILWKIAHIRSEGWVNMNHVSGVKDIAEQLEWFDLVDWIEEEVEVGSGHNHDGETWLKAATAAATGERRTISVMGETLIQIEAGGTIKID